MTVFTVDALKFDGMYLTYCAPDKAPVFVARFKRKGQYGSFMTFLIKNFTVEEYFAARNVGDAPIEILQSKGYLQPHIKRMLKSIGYPVTVAGFKRLVAEQVSATVAV